MIIMTKYPRTFHFPTSPGVQSDDKVLKNTSKLIKSPVIITEKMDGSNVTLCNGEVYARSVSTPSHHPWHSIVRKNHAWKTIELGSDYRISGEDMYGVHSIEYDGFRESETFKVFNIQYKDEWLSFDDRYAICQELNLSMAPVWLHDGIFQSEKDISMWFSTNIKRHSHHGPELEGFVIQPMNSFHINEFSSCVAKFVRSNHVQTDIHWSKNWKPCKVIHGHLSMDN